MHLALLDIRENNRRERTCFTDPLKGKAKVSPGTTTQNPFAIH
jgi:hypothetical protein